MSSSFPFPDNRVWLRVLVIHMEFELPPFENYGRCWVIPVVTWSVESVAQWASKLGPTFLKVLLGKEKLWN